MQVFNELLSLAVSRRTTTPWERGYKKHFYGEIKCFEAEDQRTLIYSINGGGEGGVGGCQKGTPITQPTIFSR